MGTFSWPGASPDLLSGDVITQASTTWEMSEAVSMTAGGCSSRIKAGVRATRLRIRYPHLVLCMGYAGGRIRWRRSVRRMLIQVSCSYNRLRVDKQL